MSTDDFVIRVIEPKDYEQIVEFLRINFYRDEPLTMGLEPKHERASNVETTMEHIANGTCIMAVERSDSGEVILGVAMTGPKGPNAANQLFEKAAKEGPSKLGQILLLLACVERDANVCNKYGVSRVLNVHATCVDAKKRGAAVAVRLGEYLTVMARNLEYQLLSGDCTSFYSARICEQLGWECVHVLRYDEYLDKDGRQIFCPPAPHDCVRTYAKRL